MAGLAAEELELHCKNLQLNVGYSGHVVSLIPLDLDQANRQTDMMHFATRSQVGLRSEYVLAFPLLHVTNPDSHSDLIMYTRNP